MRSYHISSIKIFAAVLCILLAACEPAPTHKGTGPFIVVDQFGYQPHMQKIAVLRDPQDGFDAENTYTPGTTIELIDQPTGTTVYSASPGIWHKGATDSSSGDKAWWFDFSSITQPGTYLVRDSKAGTESPVFQIHQNPYKAVLKQAFRAFYYQRAGFAKLQPFAEAPWEDAASHLGPLQDTQARLYSAPDNAATERDLHGGWYDAGDYNKYTNWTADYIISLLHTYTENPAAWDDDFNLPESGNGVADILDEIQWGLAFLERMQNTDGSVLSIVGLSHASPPSAATGPSLYGPANTSATLTTAAAFALAARVFAATENKSLTLAAGQLRTQAELAWQWAEANPRVIFKNNDEATGSLGLAAGQQEVDDDARLHKKLEAAVYLFALTGKTEYKHYFENHYTETYLIKSGWASPYRVGRTHMLLYYANLEGASKTVANHIQVTFVRSMDARHTWQAVKSESDPYRAYLSSYTWGSSGIKAEKGSLFFEQKLFNLGLQSEESIRHAAGRYIHYLHGTNPLGKVYLSNMKRFGAENSVDQFYHSWFSHGSKRWDSAVNSVFGPAPGFVVGGPNPRYNWDKCCPDSCGTKNNSLCGEKPLSPPHNQPEQKSYTDFNNSWPINSWEVTENSNSYQVKYLRLLSKFVDE